MKIEFREAGHVAKLLPVGDVDEPPLPPNEAVGIHRLQRSVDVNGGEARRIGKLLLGHWQLIALLRTKARRLEAARELAEDVREPFTRVPPADVQDPFAEDRTV